MRYLGIDIGTAFLKLSIIDEESGVLNSHYLRHHGEPLGLLKDYLNSIDIKSLPERFAITGSMVDIFDRFSDRLKPLDLVQCNISFVKIYYPRIRHIIDVGASSLTYILLNSKGELEQIKENSLCAAGTGSFVDEQLSRLGLTYESIKGFKRILNPPSIATRCAVFAKSDITHRQAEGYSKEESFSGLCKGLATTIYQSLIRGKSINEKIILLGGVTLNKEVVFWLGKMLSDNILTSPHSEIAASIGAAIIASDGTSYPLSLLLDTLNFAGFSQKRDVNLRRPLTLNLSSYPEISVFDSYIDETATEVRIYEDIRNKKLKVYAGEDIGSTSTKLALVNEDEKIVVDFYRKTAGEPVEATKHLLRAMINLSKKYNSEIEIAGFSTTGSGRKLIGELFGADLIINEITAHAEGAKRLFEGVETIFEIGGQDSKYIRIENGNVVDSSMNYICAAGTGSFIEEQAKKLGYEISEVGDKILNISPPFTSDRCTVFMEQDINRLLKKGFSKEEVLASVHYSVIQNYLNRVVGSRKISKKSIVFMGATARNKALVAAIENLLNIEVNVSPYCYINGAFGAAVMLMGQMKKRRDKSRFRGIELLDMKVDIKKSECRLCVNRCQTFHAVDRDGNRLSSWGFMCGREEEEGMKRSPNYEPYQLREKIIRESLLGVRTDYKYTIGIPRALSTYSYLPFFYNLFALLGLRPVISKRTDEKLISRGSHVLTSDFCFPIKVAFGHIRYLIEDAKTDFVFAPNMISDEKNSITTNSLFCPYLSSFGSMTNSIMKMKGEDRSKLLSFPLDLRMSIDKIGEIVYDSLKEKIGVSPEDVKNAIKTALKIQKEVEEKLQNAGREILNSIKSTDRAIVIVGRPYNSIDGDVNLSIPLKVANQGFTVIPVDMIPVDITSLKDRYENIYWEYGQRIISVLKTVSEDRRLNAIYISNFKCGPDSFLLSFAENIMKGKPMLILEMDEHGADAGYQTRIEAFVEVLRQERENLSQEVQKKSYSRALSDRIVLIPPMHEITSRLFAASFISEGYRSEALPLTDYSAFNLGKKYTRGSECLPMITTLGSLLSYIEKSRHSPSELAYFMPTATGPCRFGQYALLTDIALKEAGIEDLMILSPAAYNTYRGLSVNLRMKLWYSVVIGDLLYKIAMRIRPYEVVKGTTDRLLNKYIGIFERAIRRDLNLNQVLHSAVEDFKRIKRIEKKIPLIGVMGEIYVRSEPFSNQNLIRYIEDAGAEAWLTPLSEWFHYVSEMRLYFINNGLREANPVAATKALLFSQFFRISEDELVKIADPILHDRKEPDIKETLDAGSRYVEKLFEGETIITIGRAIEFIRSGVSLIVNVAPFNCMPGTISSGIFEQLEKDYNICILNLFYDGEGEVNKIIRTAISNISTGTKNYREGDKEKNIEKTPIPFLDQQHSINQGYKKNI